MSHSDDCSTEFGEEGFGEGPFGGGFTPDNVTTPVSDEFDIYCFGPCGEMYSLLSYEDVSTAGQPAQFVQDAPTLDLFVGSGGLFDTGDARITVDVAVPLDFTWEFNVVFRDLPPNFSDLVNKHIFFGTFDSAGNSVGLFVSSIGLLYTGAVHHSGGNLVLDNPTQPLPDSSLLIEKDVYYTVRIATSFDTATTYIYWTKQDDVDSLGHQLRYVLPAIKSSTASQVPPDSTYISVRGTALNQVLIAFDSMCLDSGLNIANAKPIADAGVDQAVRTCAVVLLDGSASFDPEGANITYKWRLLDTPLGSQYIFDGADGISHPLMVPTGFTTKFHSVDLSVVHADEPIVAGDVLILDGEPYDIVSTGSDVNGFHLVLATEIVDNLASVTFKYIRQNGISGNNLVKATFLPDKTGLFKFDLTVHDGQLYSFPAVTIVNVTESPVPRGVIPDLSFLWGYLSDFWNLVEDKERIEVFWSGLAQIAASELLNLWQLDYSKSLRDIQRTFQRRWLRYDMLMEEDPVRIERTSVQARYGGILSSAISGSVVTSVLDIEIGDTVYSVTVPPISGVGNEALELVQELQPQLAIVDPQLVVTAVVSQDSSVKKVRLNAPFAFSIKSTSTCTLFPFASNTYPQGTGVLIGERAYRTDASLIGINVQEGDLLVLDGVAYRIALVSTNDLDTYESQRITTIDPIPLDASTTNWSIGGSVLSETLDFWHGMACADDHIFLDVVDNTTGELNVVQTKVLGANQQVSNKLAIDASSVGSYLLDPAFSVHFRSVLRRHYLPIDRLIQDVPYLQEKINNSDDKEVLRRNVDFFIESFRDIKVLRFIVGSPDVWQGELPPIRLWAETTYLDNRPMIEANFGIPAKFTLDDLSQLPSNVDYLSAVRGLWFAYFNGPTLFNLRVGVQILLGLPFAEEQGTIEEIRDDFSSTQGRILIRDSKNTEIVRSYTYPALLDLEVNPATGVFYKAGDAVSQFAPLVKGSEIIDWVKDPEWIRGFINQGTSFEIEKFFKFLIRVDGTAFNLNAVIFALQFVKRIKPTYTHPIMAIFKNMTDAEISVTDLFEMKVALSTVADLFWQGFGQIQAFDQLRPSGGVDWSAFDTNVLSSPPTSPTPDSYTPWAFDGYLLAPRESAHAVLRQTLGGAGVQSAGGPFYTGLPVFTEVVSVLEDGQRFWLPPSPGYQVASKTSTVTRTLTRLIIYIRMNINSGTAVTFTLFKNGVAFYTANGTLSALGTSLAPNFHTISATISVGIVPGDVLSATFFHNGSGLNTYIEGVWAVLGIGQTWESVSIGPGTFLMVRPL